MSDLVGDPRLRGVCVHFAGSGWEDLAQQVLLCILRRRLRYDPARGSVTTWLYWITRSTYFDYFHGKHPDVTAEVTPDLVVDKHPEERLVALVMVNRLRRRLPGEVEAIWDRPRDDYRVGREDRRRFLWNLRWRTSIRSRL